MGILVKWNASREGLHLVLIAGEGAHWNANWTKRADGARCGYVRISQPLWNKYLQFREKSSRRGRWLARAAAAPHGRSSTAPP
jgi:hypothetical protein